MAAQNDLRNIKDVVDGLNDNPVSRFAYTQPAFDNDNVDGVTTFDINAANNIPKESCTDYSPTVLQKGIQTQGASIPRRAWNHFIGRTSYNLNKLVRVVGQILSHIAASSAHNCFEYDSTAKYRQGDCCYALHMEGNTPVRTVFKRVGNNPVEIINISPLAQGQTEWEEAPEGFAVQKAGALMDRIDNVIALEKQERQSGDTSTLASAKGFTSNKVDEERQARENADAALQSGKQDKITATGPRNVLTAPAVAGGQPGSVPISSFSSVTEPYILNLNIIDATELDPDLYYPVGIQLPDDPVIQNVRIEVFASLGASGLPPWASHAQGFVTKKIWETAGLGQDTLDIDRRIYCSQYKWVIEGGDPIKGLDQNGVDNCEVVYVRGGGRYTFRCSHGVLPQLYAEGYFYSTIGSGGNTYTLDYPVRDKTDATLLDIVSTNVNKQTRKWILPGGQVLGNPMLPCGWCRIAYFDRRNLPLCGTVSTITITAGELAEGASSTVQMVVALNRNASAELSILAYTHDGFSAQDDGMGGLQQGSRCIPQVRIVHHPTQSTAYLEIYLSRSSNPPLGAPCNASRNVGCVKHRMEIEAEVVGDACHFMDISFGSTPAGFSVVTKTVPPAVSSEITSAITKAINTAITPLAPKASPTLTTPTLTSPTLTNPTVTGTANMNGITYISGHRVAVVANASSDTLPVGSYRLSYLSRTQAGTPPLNSNVTGFTDVINYGTWLCSGAIQLDSQRIGDNIYSDIMILSRRIA